MIKARSFGTWKRDDLVHVYETVNSGTPGYNPIWYRVFGGYMHRARLQKVRIHYNPPLPSVPDTKLLAEVTVPFAQPTGITNGTGGSDLLRYITLPSNGSPVSPPVRTEMTGTSSRMRPIRTTSILFRPCN